MRNGNYILIKAPSDYPGKRYRGRYCYEHHYVYWANTGIVVKSNYVVHHKDENTHNNSFSNLKLMQKDKHTSQHGFDQGVQMVLLRCPGCKIKFRKERRLTHLIKKTAYTCCSRKCIGKFSKVKVKDPDKFKRRIRKNVVKEYVYYKQ